MLKGLLAVLLMFMVVATHVTAGNQPSTSCGKEGFSNTVDCSDGSSRQVGFPNAGSDADAEEAGVLEFGFTSFSRFRKANFILGQLLVEGERCHRAISQGAGFERACAVFVERTQPGAEFSRSLQVVLKTLRDDRAFYERHVGEFSKLKQMAEEVNGHLKFLQAHAAD